MHGRIRALIVSIRRGTAGAPASPRFRRPALEPSWTDQAQWLRRGCKSHAAACIGPKRAPYSQAVLDRPVGPRKRAKIAVPFDHSRCDQNPIKLRIS
jgi:hypothetical protein